MKIRKIEKSKLNEILTPLQYHVTQENGTEPPFRNEYWDNTEAGLYVDIVSGEPLFTSNEKFDHGCGWPSFTMPISEIVTRNDYNFNMIRTEVRSMIADSHLGHVFEDGPKDKGGFRFCINSAALKFIPVADLEKEGYGEFIHLFQK